MWSKIDLGDYERRNADIATDLTDIKGKTHLLLLGGRLKIEYGTSIGRAGQEFPSTECVNSYCSDD